jgi:hypothetical protein
MFEFIVVYPLAFYGAYVLLGMPKTDAIVSLGSKVIAWVRSKFQ